MISFTRLGLFLALFAASAFAGPYDFLVAQITEMARVENALRQEHIAYGIPPEIAVVTFLQNHIAMATQKLKDDPGNSNHWLMELGAAHHWLGHAAEETSDFVEAKNQHALSLELFQKSGLLSSDKLDVADVVSHAQGHLCLLEHGRSIVDFYMTYATQGMPEVGDMYPKLSPVPSLCVQLMLAGRDK